jgi:hypothetical protein
MLFWSLNEASNAVGPIDNGDVVPGCYHKYAVVTRAVIWMVQYKLLLFASISRGKLLFSLETAI